MEPTTIILLVLAILAIDCVIGIVRKWNKRNPLLSPNEPLVHLTPAGWLLAIAVLIVFVGSIVVIWPTWVDLGIPQRRRVFAQGIVMAALGVALAFLLVAWVALKLLGVKAARSEEVKPPPPKQVRFRLEDSRKIEETTEDVPKK